MFSKLKRRLFGKHTNDNSLFTMRVYRHEGMWVFDNPAVDLIKEPFVAGADTIFDEIAYGYDKQFETSDKIKIDIVFSSKEFPGWEHMCEHTGKQYDGNTYVMCATTIPTLKNHDLWLCPALLKYFSTPPRTLFMSVTQTTKS